MDEQNFEIQKIKPGLLVTESIRRNGGIQYQREMRADYVHEESRIREWETKSIIPNELEYRTRTNLISGAYLKLRRVCVQTSVGLICPQSKEPKLREIISELHKEFAEFNQSSKTCKVKARYGFFQVEEANQAAIAAVSDQIAEMATQVETALTQGDLDALRGAPTRFLNKMTPEQIMLLPTQEKNTILARVRAEAVRSAISEAKGLDSIVSDELSADVKEVVQRSRKIASQLYRRVAKKNEDIDDVLAEVDLSGIRRMRTAFISAAAKADKKAAECQTTISTQSPLV